MKLTGLVNRRKVPPEKVPTNQLAIVNRSAIALATDSAVTLTVRGAEKIYNSADKLFELSDRDPIGIMIYNNLEHMGVSLEVAIKQLRQKRTRRRAARQNRHQEFLRRSCLQISRTPVEER